LIDCKANRPAGEAGRIRAISLLKFAPTDPKPNTTLPSHDTSNEPARRRIVIPVSRIPYSSPSALRTAARSTLPPAKSSNARAGGRIMCLAMNGAPSSAPCWLSLKQHSHSIVAQPS
jgi:hypothetical protein